MTRKSRRLHPEDLELWGRVAKSARPLKSDLAKAFDAPEQAEPVFAPTPVKPPPKPPRQGGTVLRPTPPDRPAMHDLARPLPDALAGAPVSMDKRKFQRMTRGKLQPDARIDLHGMTLAQAHAALNGFILRAQSQGLRLVLVITGKGKSVADDGPIPRRRGALKHDVPQWLRMAPLAGAVLELREAHLRHGGSGAYYVYLRKGR
ncbi:Smr/MutS family protein [Roseinatronobacter alkalisoli]|uniref:Smr/MutS family protein n=1 Tax=Roseinatronobacter alkalisoli TaxID=3028235 RepID=A0ABT5T9W3_9RHOB|nr:Smr/MutS family protein [Roseinatronobacter sp. HJB301]MDD7971906.1 Smr/MutS family protein [Roseinatronobacter sp. HJB301]